MAVIDARPMTVDLNVYAGDDLKLHLEVTDDAGAPFDLTGYTAEAQIRASADAPAALAFTATVLANAVDLVLPTAISTTMPIKAVWDVQVVSAAGAVTTLAAGKVTVTPEVTRAQVVADDTARAGAAR